MNDELEKNVKNLIEYVTVESWKYCQDCGIVEPNKMLPNYGNQKLSFLNDCLCQKGRYFVPTVRFTFIYFFCMYYFLYYKAFSIGAVTLPKNCLKHFYKRPFIFMLISVLNKISHIQYKNINLIFYLRSTCNIPLCPIFGI